MKRRIAIREAAKRDLRDFVDFIAEENPQAAIRFLKAAERTFKLLVKLPAIGASYAAVTPALRKIRCFRVKRFPNCLIFYVPLAHGIEIVRIIHGARDIEAIFDS